MQILLQKDLIQDPARQHLVHLPKALLPVADEPLLSHWVRLIEDAFYGTNDDEKDHHHVQVVLVVNDKYLPQFKQW